MSRSIRRCGEKVNIKYCKGDTCVASTEKWKQMKKFIGRKSTRLPHYDYSSPGYYFVTVCTYNHQCIFGEVINEKMILNKLGDVVQNCWDAIPSHIPDTKLDAFKIMPNHIHGIIFITDVGVMHASPLRNQSGPKPRSLGSIVGSFKSACTNRINRIRNTPGNPVWQRNYYERVIRDEDELNQIREYIVHNPLKWDLDRNSSENIDLV